MKVLCSIFIIMTMGWNQYSLAELLLIPTLNRTKVLVFCTRSFQAFLSLMRGLQFLSLAYLDHLLLHLSIIRTIFFSFSLHPLQVWTTDWNFLVVTDPLLYWKSLITTWLRTCFLFIYNSRFYLTTPSVAPFTQRRTVRWLVHKLETMWNELVVA